MPAAAGLLLSGCDWFTDFKQQPSVGPWQHFSTDSAANRGFRGNPVGSVPTTGAVAPGFMISYANLPATIDSFSVIKNPVAPDARSLANGRKYFTINCAVCHGDLGDGNGTLRQVNPMYSFAPSLLLDVTKQRADGYIFGMIRNGRATMPPYNRIEDADRWDVVNYVRGLQGKLGAPVPTGPVGLPGETGDKLPGATRIGPTVPSAYAHPAHAT
ncbi:MAG TPA: cytochrome c, partial [Gemmatimonadaceae bacterium]|nr:cytochrome c [Gemmatimonadaceae bacterium]